MWRSLCLLPVALALFAMSSCSDGGSGGGGAITAARSDIERETSPEVPRADGTELQAGNAAFAFDLYHELAAEPGNLFLSPHSISTALAMTYAGARGETATEMAATLHFTLPQDRLHAALNALDLELAKRPKVRLTDEAKGEPPELTVANATWGDREYRFLDEYLDLLARNYGAGLQLLDFRGDPDGSREVINSWVEEQTKDRIKDLLPPDAIDPDTRLVLTNVIYFKASWETPFSESQTKPGPFHLLDGTETQVDVMHEGVNAGYARAGDLQAVELSYVGREIGMLIIVPDEGTFAEAEASLDAASFAALAGGLSAAHVTLALPKFEFEWEQSLVDPLRALGMVSPFEGADFSGMDGTGNLVISDVLHKSFIAVDEKGTEAAAATAVIMRETAAPIEVVELTIDRPFIFAIRDRPTGAILFLGRYTGPQ